MLLPEHILLSVPAFTASAELTIMLIELLVAVVGLAQVAVDVMLQLITSPFAGVYVYVDEVAPLILTPPFFHW